MVDQFLVIILLAMKKLTASSHMPQICPPLWAIKSPNFSFKLKTQLTLIQKRLLSQAVKSDYFIQFLSLQKVAIKNGNERALCLWA